MNAKLIFALVLAFALAGCNGTVPPVTAEPTAVIPTEVPPTAVPFPTPTLEPTTIPTEVPPTPTLEPSPTPTVTPIPSVWEIAEKMLAECSLVFDMTQTPPSWMRADFSYGEASRWYIEEFFWRQWWRGNPTPSPDEYPTTAGPNTFSPTLAPLGEYELEIAVQIIAVHPEFVQVGPRGLRLWSFAIGTQMLRNNGKYHNPFGEVDQLFVTAPSGDFLPDEYENSFCPFSFLFTEFPPEENGDGDGILVGRAYLFYEVGGTDPFKLDGELREVIFTFPPVP